jgi:hypothetical protein
MWKRLKVFLTILFFFFLSFKSEGQNVTYTFIDPCTKAVTNFSLPIQGGTVIYFYGKSASFTAADVASGAFSSWINQTYSDYRKLTPCSVQSVGVVRNQITSQVIGNVVSSVVGSINSSVMAGASLGGGNDAGSRGESGSSQTRSNGNNNSGSNNSSNSNGSNGNGSTSSSNNSGGQGNGSVPSGGGGQGGQTGSQSGGSGGQTSQGGNSNNGGNGNNGGSGSNNGNSNNNNSNTESSEKGSEVVATTAMNVDVRNDKGSESSSSSSGGGGGGKKGSAKAGNSNPMIISSDLTSAQNLDKSFTAIANVGLSRTSLMGTSSWGVTGMIWMNFKQFAISSRYTKIKMNDKGTLKFVHNVNLTGAYSFGNLFSFVGYSMIINAKKWGVTGYNISGAIAKLPTDSNLFISPSITAFYTRPFSPNKKLTISPELYLISTPVVYSSFDKVTVTDRTFSAFIGSGFDYQLSKRFKFNINYKANISTNKDFPILSFFLIGSKVNL